MALRDAVVGLSSIAAATYLDILPTGTEQWAIHNIYHEDAVELYWYDGTNSIKFDSDTTFGYYPCHDFHCTTTKRIRVKNVHASAAKFIGYDGVITRV